MAKKRGGLSNIGHAPTVPSPGWLTSPRNHRHIFSLSWLKAVRIWRSIPRSCRSCSIAVAEYRPCFQFARRHRSKPSGVRGPVAVPPCIRHLPFRMAGPRQAVPRRVLAPHRGAELGSPGRLPFCSRPVLCSRGCASPVIVAPLPVPLWCCRDSAHDRLSTCVNVDVLHYDFLLSGLALQFRHSFKLLDEKPF